MFFRELYARNQLPRFHDVRGLRIFREVIEFYREPFRGLIDILIGEKSEHILECDWRLELQGVAEMPPVDDEQIKLRTGRIFMDNRLIVLTILIIYGSWVQTVEGKCICLHKL